MNSSYQEVNVDEEVPDNKTSGKTLLKQILICSSAWTHYFLAGLCKGAPTVFIPQIRKEANSTDIIDSELSSWLYSTSSISLLPWVIILPLTTKHFGRKLPQIISFIICLIIYTILYCSKTPYHILISDFFQGFLHAYNFTVGNMIIIEYSSPKYRGLFLTIQNAGFFWGLWVANAIGTYFHWKNIAIIGFISSISLATSFFCPESPTWLASKRRFDDCRQNFRWIYGLGAEKDLQELITSQKEDHESKIGVCKSIRSNIRCPEFYKPLILSVMAALQYMFSGKVVCSIFVLDIFRSITSSEDAAYRAMLILDGVTVFSMYVGSYLCKILKRRTLYMTTSWSGVAFLLIISLYLFLIRLKVLSEHSYVTLALFTAYSLSISCGPMILSISIYGEIISRRFQASCYMIIALTFTIVYSFLYKFASKMFVNFGLDGTFLLFGVACGLCTLYLFLFLPETKNKSHWEIEQFFKDKKTNENSVLN